MIKVGDKVVPYFDMTKVGVVISIESYKSKMLTTMGPTSLVQFAIVKLPNAEMHRFKMEDLLRADE